MSAGERGEADKASWRWTLQVVLDSVDEGIVLRDHEGTVRVLNRRASELFGVEAGDFLDRPVADLLRTIARRTEDPEGFMETFQELRTDPELELRVWVEQIIPERRQLRLFSGPAHSDAGVRLGRIDVYTDVTESARRAEEVERLYERAVRTAESYQRSLLPAGVPSLPGFNVVAHYIPAAGRRAVCGDFYDFLPLEDGRVGLVLGDVCGVGPPAANDAALARYTLRSFAPETLDPAALLRRLNSHLRAQMGSERFVRLLLGVLDPERGSLDYVNAGHVAPVIYRHDSSKVEWLSEGGLALGIEPEPAYEVERTSLTPGDMLVLYTDGATESIRMGRPFGQGKFSDLVEAYGVGTPGELVQAIRRSVEAWTLGEELRDDLAVLVCQMAPERAGAQPARELVLPNEPARLSEIRAFVGAFLADVRAPVALIHEAVLAINEAAANACKHGRNARGRSEIRVRCAVEDSTVKLTVADDGPGIDPDALALHGLPDRFASGGRGLFLMRSLMDTVDVASSESGTTVTLTRRMPDAA